MVLEEVFNAAQSLGNLVDGRGIRAAYMTFTAGTEGAAGHERHMLRGQELFGKLVGGVAGGLDGRENL